MCCDTLLVTLGLVLADLPFAYPPGDGDFYTHHLLNEPLREILGRIFHLPRLQKIFLLLRGQGSHLLPHPMGIISNLQRTVSMDDDIVPGVLIRLAPKPTIHSGASFFCIEFGIGRRSNIASNAEQGAESVEGIETAVETESEFVEIGLQVLRADAVMNAT